MYVILTFRISISPLISRSTYFSTLMPKLIIED